MADKPDVSTAISAASSKMYHGGVVYTFPDGSTLELHGGGGISYRANSPGFHGETNQVERYGAIGVAESTKPNDKGKYPNVLVFATKAAADAGLAKKLNEIDSGFGNQHPTVSDILEKYNGGGNPNYVSDFFNGFHHPDITAKTDYRGLTDEQKAQLRERVFHEEGYDNPEGYVEAIKRDSTGKEIYRGTIPDLIKGRTPVPPEDEGHGRFGANPLDPAAANLALSGATGDSGLIAALPSAGAPSDGDGARLGAIPVAPAAAADVTEGDPDGNGDLAALLKLAGPDGGGALTMAGVQQLMRFLDADKTMEGRAQSAMEQNLLRAARAQIAGPDGPDGTAGPEGEARFQNFLGAYFPALDRGLNSGKTAAELLTPGSPDYLGKLIPAFTPPPAQKSNLVLAAGNDGIEVTPLPPPPPSAENNIPGTNIPDRGITAPTLSSSDIGSTSPA